MTDNSSAITFGLEVTGVYCFLMVVGFLLVWKQKNAVRWAPFLLSMGVFGTFLGISIALWNFDAGAVESSVPGLIGGMKMAFISSALGIFLSLTLRFRELWSKTSTDDEKTTEDIFELLANHTSHLEALQAALVGDGDTTLITQLKLIRQESRDGTQKICSSLDDFAATLAENNSKTFISALQEAIRDFNEKMSEQFGENFKRLNEAVGQLLEWQARYREQLTEMMQAFENIRSLLDEASSQIGEVATQTKALGNVSKRQAEWLEAQRTAQTELEERLAAFAEMAEQAQSALPLVNQNLKEVTEGVKRTVRDGLVAMEQAMESLETGASDSRKQVAALTESLSNEVKTSVTSFQQQSLDAHTRHQHRLEESISELDRMLGEQLSKSLQALAGQLATLSDRFVADYQPLTESLREVVELSKRIER